MELIVEKRVEFDEEKYAEWAINDMYDRLEDEQGEDWRSLSEDQQDEFVVSALEIAIEKMKGERE
jgi:hypothetical protein